MNYGDEVDMKTTQKILAFLIVYTDMLDNASLFDASGSLLASDLCSPRDPERWKLVEQADHSVSSRLVSSRSVPAAAPTLDTKVLKGEVGVSE